MMITVVMEEKTQQRKGFHVPRPAGPVAEHRDPAERHRQPRRARPYYSLINYQVLTLGRVLVSLPDTEESLSW